MPGDLGENLKQWRERNNLTRRQAMDVLAAYGFRTTVDSIYSWESRRSKPEKKTVRAVEFILDRYPDVDFKELFPEVKATNAKIEPRCEQAVATAGIDQIELASAQTRLLNRVPGSMVFGESLTDTSVQRRHAGMREYILDQVRRFEENASRAMTFGESNIGGSPFQ